MGRDWRRPPLDESPHAPLGSKVIALEVNDPGAPSFCWSAAAPQDPDGKRPLTLSEDLVRFIEQHIHSILQLEVLLLLREKGGEWTAATVAGELRITEQSAEVRLRDLHLRGLLALGDEPESYCYKSTDPEISRLVDLLSDAYRDMRYTVINLIFSVPGDSARSLAEAFRLRKRKDE
jgi:hypothetical protein